MPVPPLSYTIEGVEFTSVSLSKKLNCSTNTARRRLMTCTRLKDLYIPIRTEGGFADKLHTIEGLVVTTTEVMKKLKCSRETARNRIHKSNTLVELLRPVKLKVNKTQNLTEATEDELELAHINKLLFGAWQ